MRQRWGWLTFLVLAAAQVAWGQTVAVPNPSFEDGVGGPGGWALQGGYGQGRWLSGDAADGKKAVVASGKGKSEGSSSWMSGPLPLTPNTVYRLRFQARSLGASGGTPISGPAFCNRDLGQIPEKWTAQESIFLTPRDLRPEDTCLRFGQWEVSGEVAFDAVELAPAVPVYARSGDITLGEGESIAGNEYAFQAPHHGESRNQSRPLAWHTSHFNSDRWVFSAGSEVVYRHRIAGRKQTAAEVQVSVTWYSAGELVVEASADGKSWQPLGTVGKLSGAALKIPAAMLPADEVWVRLRAQPVAGGDDKKSKVASLQVGQYGYKATLAGEPIAMVGATRFVAILKTDPRFDVTIEDLGEGLPHARNRLAMSVKNRSGKPLLIGAVVTAVQPGRYALRSTEFGVPLGQGAEKLTVPYLFVDTGDVRLRIEVGVTKETAPGQAVETDVHGFAAEVSFTVAGLHDAFYGEALPATSEKVGLWWASSGWKVSRVRPVPKKEGQAVVIRAAKNEAEAAQVVLRPAEALRGLTVRAEALAGPGGAVLAAENIDILRVRYVNVTQPTDAAGTAAPWPDPLPPLAGPIDLEAGKNQPLWIRVRVHKDARAGKYEGKIRLAAAGGYAADVPLSVEVFDFALPDRMTCQTAFGFSPANVWRYQKVEKPEDRRAVLEKYLANFAAHHISPYDPAPLDNFKVTWPKKKGGTPDEEKGLVPEFDWSAWDAAMTRAIGQHRFNTFMVHVPGLGGGTFEFRVQPEFLGYKEGAPEYKTALTNYLSGVQEHLRQMGWLKYAYVYWFDEPDKKDYEYVMDGFRKLKEAAPDLRRMLTEQVEPQLVGGPNLWCPLTSNYDHARAEERRKAGEQFWWYVCCGPKAPYATLFIDHPATELRVWLWQTWQRRIDGILVWEATYWTSDTAYPDRARPQNPYEDPMGWVTGYGTAKGVRQPWGNGDGRFIYPPEAAADAAPAAPVLDGPVDSIRWEMLRDGVEDYEYLAILRGLLAARGEKLSAADRAKYAALLEVPEEITKDMTTFTKDPAPIERRREAIARAIEAMSKP
jgi:hypothetical protein